MDAGIQVQTQVGPQPVKVGPVTVTVRLADAAGGPIMRAAVTVEGDMSHPGMAPVFSTAREIDGGLYQASMDFPMAGDWSLIVQARLQDGQAIEREVAIHGVRAK